MLGVYKTNAASEKILLDMIEDGSPSVTGGASTLTLASTVKPGLPTDVQEYLKTHSNGGVVNLYSIGADNCIHARSLDSILNVTAVTWTDNEAMTAETDKVNDAKVAGAGTGA